MFQMNDSEEINYWDAFIDGDFDALSVLFLQYAKRIDFLGEENISR